MRHKLTQLISVILIAAFTLQGLAWGHTKGEGVSTGVDNGPTPLSPGLRHKDWRISLRLKNGPRSTVSAGGGPADIYGGNGPRSVVCGLSTVDGMLRPRAMGETDEAAPDRMMPKSANRSNITLAQADLSKDAQKVAELMNVLLPLVRKGLGGLGFRPYEVKYYITFILSRARQMPEESLRTIDGYVKALTDQSDVNYAMTKGERDYMSEALQASWGSSYPDGPQNIGKAIFDEIDGSIDDLIADKKTTRKLILTLCGTGLGEPLELGDIVNALLHKGGLSAEESGWDLVIRYYDIRPSNLRSLEKKLVGGSSRISILLNRFKSVKLDLRYCDLHDQRQYPFIFGEESDIIIHRHIRSGNGEPLDIHSNIMEAMRGSLTPRGIIIFNDYDREIALNRAGIITPKCVREAKELILKMGLPDGATFISVSPGWIRLSEYNKNHFIVPWEQLFAEAGASVVVYEPDRHIHNMWEGAGKRLEARGMILRAKSTPFQDSGIGRGGASAVLIVDDLSHEFMTEDIRKARASKVAEVLCGGGYLIVGWGNRSNTESARTGARNILKWITESGYQLVETGKVFENYDGTHNRFAHDWVCYRVYSQEQGQIASVPNWRSVLEAI